MIARAWVEDGFRVEIGECRLDTDLDIALATAEALLNADEQARADSFVFTRDRDRFVRGRGYLRRQLGAALKLTPEDVPIVVGDDGKPYVAGAAIRFNLSHSDDHAVLAITLDGEVGIDLETVNRSADFEGQLPGLAEMCFTAEEQRALAGLPRERRVRRFLSYWTAKEARMKLTGEGFALDPRTIALKLSRGRPVGYRRPAGPDTDLRFIPLSNGNTICCVAIQRHGARGAAGKPAH